MGQSFNQRLISKPLAFALNLVTSTKIGTTSAQSCKKRNMKIQKVKLGDLKTGDQIAVRGNVEDLGPCLRFVTAHSNGTYFHHGIYNKDEMCVYELHGDNKENAKPKKRDFTEFFAGRTELYRVEYEEGEYCFPVNETIKRAEEAVEQGSSWPAYDLIINNCESFATYLKTGRNVSKQALLSLIEGVVKVASLTKAGSSLLRK